MKEPTELQRFTFWLEAECLEAEWRLDAYSKILDVCKSDDVSIAIQVEALCELLPNHTAKVLECFAKLTDEVEDNNIYIQTEEAKTILKAGFKSTDESVCVGMQHKPMKIYSVKADLIYWIWTINSDTKDTDEYLDGFG